MAVGKTAGLNRVHTSTPEFSSARIRSARWVAHRVGAGEGVEGVVMMVRTVKEGVNVRLGKVERREDLMRNQVLADGIVRARL